MFPSQQARTLYAVFHSFYNDRKQDSATNTTHSKRTIELLKQHNIMSNTLSTIWGNINGCDNNYICATSLYLISMLSQAFYVIIDRGISAPGHVKEVVYGLNDIAKRFLFQ